MIPALPSTVFRWSAPIPRDGYPRPSHPAPDLYRVADLAPLRAWLDAHGYNDVTIIRGARVRLELPTTPQPARGEHLAGLAHILREAGLLVEEHRVLHVTGLWLDDAIPYGTRLPSES